MDDLLNDALMGDGADAQPPEEDVSEVQPPEESFAPLPRVESATESPPVCSTGALPSSGIELAAQAVANTVGAVGFNRIRNRVCCGCKCSAMSPSPICGTPHRQWAGTPVDPWSGDWCRWCWELIHSYYVPHIFPDLAGLVEWIGDAIHLKSFFHMVTCLFTLKLERMHAVSIVMLDQRSKTLKQVACWQNFGCLEGVPQPKPVTTWPLKDAHTVIGNPFLLGAVACSIMRDGKHTLGVKVDVDRDCGERVVENPLSSPLRHLLDSPVLSTDDVEAKALFDDLAAEWLALQRAHGGHIDAQLDSGTATLTVSSPSALTENRLVPGRRLKLLMHSSQFMCT